MLEALFALIVHGDYITQWNAYGIAEDHWFIDMVLSSTGR